MERPEASGYRASSLPNGSSPEFWATSASLRLRGRFDLLTVDGSVTRIVDYKTGAESPSHVDQLIIYAAIWAKKEQPDKIHPHINQLIVSYPTHDVVIEAPSETEITQISAELGARIDQMLTNLTMDPIPARPLEANCRHCDVRHLCTPYWETLRGSVPERDFVDVEFRVIEANGPRSLIGSANGVPNTILRVHETDRLEIGTTYRVTDVRRDPEVEIDEPRLSLSKTSASEIYTLK